MRTRNCLGFGFALLFQTKARHTLGPLTTVFSQMRLAFPFRCGDHLSCNSSAAWTEWPLDWIVCLFS